MAGSIGSTRQFPTVVDPPSTHGQTCQDTTRQSYTRHLVSRSAMANPFTFSRVATPQQFDGPCDLCIGAEADSICRHFRWMAEHGVDGAFLQRFAGQIDREIPGNEGILRIRDEVGDLVRDAAEKEGRVWAIM